MNIYSLQLFEYKFTNVILMVRPKKSRIVMLEPNVTYFKPRAIPLSELEEVRLSVDEFEAIRLKDVKGLKQSKAAKKMNVSQSTFHRLLISARKKLADAIVNGKAIKIEGGIYSIKLKGSVK